MRITSLNILVVVMFIKRVVIVKIRSILQASILVFMVSGFFQSAVSHSGGTNQIGCHMIIQLETFTATLQKTHLDNPTV